VAKKGITVCLVCVVLGLAGYALFAAAVPAKTASKEKMVVATFDSRAVAVAYAHSDLFKQRLLQKKKALADAEAAGNKRKAAELRLWPEKQQERLHKQGFGRADVTGLLQRIEGDIAQIAENTGVDIILSKWDVVYQKPDAETVDITDEIVKPFKPNKRALDIIRDLANHPPLAEEVLEKMDHAHD
jgi:Skp family chaperone for outer membrane proteins